MATVDSEEILNEIKQHAAALLLLSKTHGTVYQTWLGSLEYEKRQEWTQLVGLSGGKGRRRRKQVESLISQRGKTPNRPTPETSKVSAWDKREDLFVLCTNITVEELVNLNHLADVGEPTSFFKATEHFLAQYDFAEAYRRSLGRETRRVRERILERFECLVFYLNLVIGGFHSGTGWLHGGHNRLLEIQKPPDDLVTAKKRNERTAERGLSYYCWGIFLGDLRNLIRLRADEDVPESLYGDRHHRPRIPYYANQFFESGLCGNVSRIQTCVDSVIRTWPMIPKTVTLQVIMPLMQGRHWDLLASEEKKRSQERIYATAKISFPDVDINVTDDFIGVTLDQVCAQRPAALPSQLSEIGRSLQSLEGERPSADSISLEMLSEPNVLESEMAWQPVPDLMYGAMLTSFVKPMHYSSASDPGYRTTSTPDIQTETFSNRNWHDHSMTGLFSATGMDPWTCQATQMASDPDVTASAEAIRL